MFTQEFEREMAANKVALIAWLEGHGLKVTWSVDAPDIQVREFSTRSCGSMEIARAEIKGGPYSWQHSIWEWNNANEWRHRSITGDRFSDWEKWY